MSAIDRFWRFSANPSSRKHVNLSVLGVAMDLHLGRLTDRENPLIVYALTAAVLMLIGVTAISSLDFTNGKRR